LKGGFIVEKRKRVKVEIGELVAVGFIRNNQGEVLLVDKKNRLTLPTGHMDLKLEGQLRETAIREMFEELIGLKHLTVTGSLGTMVRNKSSPPKLMEIFSCKASRREVKSYKEGKVIAWIRPSQAMRLDKFLDFLDEVAKEGIKRFLEGYPRKSVEKKGGQNDGGTNESFRKGPRGCMAAR